MIKTLLVIASVICAIGVARDDDAPLKVGDRAPEISALAADGNALTSNGLQGKVVLLTFWSMDDKNYEKVAEAFKAVRAAHRDQSDLQLISVCVDDDWERWMEYLDKQPPLDKEHPLQRFYSDRRWWQYVQVGGDETTANKYGVRQTPTTFLIDRAGKLAALNIVPVDIAKSVDRALKNE